MGVASGTPGQAVRDNFGPTLGQLEDEIFREWIFPQHISRYSAKLGQRRKGLRSGWRQCSTLIPDMATTILLCIFTATATRIMVALTEI